MWVKSMHLLVDLSINSQNHRVFSIISIKVGTNTLYRENFRKFFSQDFLVFIQKVLILFNIKGFIMTYMIKFVVNIIAIFTLFFVGMTLLFAPEKANFSYYVFVILMSTYLGYNYIKKRDT